MYFCLRWIRFISNLSNNFTRLWTVWEWTWALSIGLPSNICHSFKRCDNDVKIIITITLKAKTIMVIIMISIITITAIMVMTIIIMIETLISWLIWGKQFVEELLGGSLSVQCDISNSELFWNVLVNRLYFGWDPQIAYSFYTIAPKGNLCFCFVTNWSANRSIFYLYKGTNIANFLWKTGINWTLSGLMCTITVIS